MSNEIALRKDDISTMELGQVLAKSGYFTDAKDAAQAIVKVLAGRELGIGPIASMMGIYIVKGKVTLSAALIGATIKRSGRYNYRVIALDDGVCEIVFTERGEEIGRSVFDLEDAKTAGLMSNETYRKFPRNMLLARALSNGARWYCPDVFSGPIYTPDELGEAVNEDGEVASPQRLAVEAVYEDPAPVQAYAATTAPRASVPAEEPGLFEEPAAQPSERETLEAELKRAYDAFKAAGGVGPLLTRNKVAAMTDDEITAKTAEYIRLS